VISTNAVIPTKTRAGLAAEPRSNAESNVDQIRQGAFGSSGQSLIKTTNGIRAPKTATATKAGPCSRNGAATIQIRIEKKTDATERRSLELVNLSCPPLGLTSDRDLGPALGLVAYESSEHIDHRSML